MNKLMKWSLAVACAVVGTGSVMAQGDGGPLIDALVKKGVLNSQEAEEIRADMTTDLASTPGGMISWGSSAVRGIKIYGDARFRYEYDRVQRSAANGIMDVRERNRNRYRVRIGAEYMFTDNFRAGLQLSTNSSGTNGTINGRNSANSDFGTIGNRDNVGVDLVYLTWGHAFSQDWLELTGGRQKLGHNIQTGWTWDSDINPDGGLVKLGNFEPVSGFTIASTHGAYVWADAATDNAFAAANGPASQDDVWLFINQIDFAYKINSDWNVRVSPGFFNSMGSNSNTTTAINGNLPTGLAAATDTRDLNVLFIDAAVETPFFLSNSKGKLYGEYGINLTADKMAERFNQAANGSLGTDRDSRDQFFLVGYQVAGGGSKGKGKGGWSLDATYAYYENYSWSAALTDSDWHGGALNGKGFGIKAAYNLTENITGSVNYRRSEDIDDAIVATAAGAGNLGQGNVATDLVQVDLVWKF